MPDTPTYASLLTRLFSGTPDDRIGVGGYLKENPDAAHAVEPVVRDRLRDSFPGTRTVAAEAVFRVYGDVAAAVETLAGVLKLGDPAVAADTLKVLTELGPAGGPLVGLLARHTPELFAHQLPRFHRWAGGAAVRSGPDGPKLWAELVGDGTEWFTPPLLMGLADAAPGVDSDLGPLEPSLRGLLGSDAARVAAGAALWRVTWRVNRDWLAALDPADGGLEVAGLRELVLGVLVEHLGRRPDLAGLVRDMLTALAGFDLMAATDLTRRLAAIGPRGWGVLAPMLGPPRPGGWFSGSDDLRGAIFREALGCRRLLRLAHHHAHRAVAAAAAAGATNDLVPPAVRVLAELGPAAGTAVPDLLDLAGRAPAAAPDVAAALPKVAGGYPNAPAAVVRALHRLRLAADFGDEHLAAFEALAGVLAELAPDAAPALVENTAVDVRVADLLLQQPAWRDASRDGRRRHAGMIADRLASPRPEVRLRAAELLRHYRGELPGVWPALAAALVGADEAAALAVIPYFQHLAPGPDTDETAEELIALFREPNPVYAARAVVALWRLGRMPLVSADLRKAVESDPEAGWGWAVLRAVLDRVSQAHGLLRDLRRVFAAAPAAVAARVDALVNPPETEAEARLTACVPRGDPASPPEVRWDDVYALVKDIGTAGPLVFLALMCEYGSAGFASPKIWMIKANRELTGNGLADAKGVVERVVATLPGPGAPAVARRQAVREWFAGRTELPVETTGLLAHPVSWYRWAGLELADAWGLTAEQAKELTEERVWDPSPRVRERALRMVRG